MKWYISENGTNSEQCGRSAESPCRTISPVVRQFDTITTFASIDMLDQVADVWIKASEQLQISSDYFYTLGILEQPIFAELIAYLQLLDRSTQPTSVYPTDTLKSTPSHFTTTDMNVTPRSIMFTSRITTTTQPDDFRLSGYVTLCGESAGKVGKVNHGIIDYACRQTKMIYLRYILSNEDRTYVSRELDRFCIVRRDVFIKMFTKKCWNSWYSREYYQYARIFLDEIQVHIISELRSVHFQIITGMNQEITKNAVMADMQTDTDEFYHVHIISNANKTIHIDILNNTFNKVHLHLDNSRISVHIKDNIFREAGITISSTSTDSHQPVIIENNIFQGNKTDMILEVLSTTNVIISSSVFQNS